MENSVNIKELNDRIAKESQFVDMITLEMGKVIVGQKALVENLLIGLLANGHILLEGVPGLAKTLAINTLAQCVNAKFARIQFTPDLLPADLTGTLIYSQKEYYHHLSLLLLYESFFRMEKIFASLFMSMVGKEEQEAYVRMRNLYSNELKLSYEYEKRQMSRFGKPAEENKPSAPKEGE